MASDPLIRAWSKSIQAERDRKRRAAEQQRWNQPFFDIEKGPHLSGIRIESDPAKAPEPFKFKPLPKLSMAAPKELKYDSPFKQDFSIPGLPSISQESRNLAAIGEVDPLSLDTGSMFSGVLPGGRLEMPSLTGMASKVGLGGSSLPEFSPAALGGVGAAAGIGAGLIGSAVAAKDAARKEAGLGSAQWHAKRTDPALHEIERQEIAPVDAARRGAGMEGRKVLAANVAGGSGWLQERAGESMADSFGRAAAHAQARAAERGRRLREENEEERLRKVAQAKAQPAQAGKFFSDLVGLIPGPVGQIGRVATGLGSKMLSSAIT
tara:strand:+ start:361 stop:1326 length:966 start_codon:yes stop_codon:yes gene_type:complete